MNAPGAQTTQADQEHPSPHRDKTSPLALFTGLLLAPLAWFIQLCIETPLLSARCYPHEQPFSGPVPEISAWVLLVDALTLLLTICSFAVSWRSWCRTHREKPGDRERLLGSGDGRTRFMAMSGMLSSGLITVAVVYISMLHIVLRECGL